MANGIVVAAPNKARVHPTARRWLSFNRSANSNPSPAPSATRVPAIKASSGVVNHAVRDTLSHLEKIYQVKASAIYPTATTYPAIATLKLPIEAEPAPSLKR